MLGLIGLISITAFLVPLTADDAFARRVVGARSPGITIWDDQYKVVHVLNGKKAMDSFKKVWMDRSPVNADSIIPHWSFKLDMPDSTRWLYDPRGYAQELSTSKKPLFRIRKVETFNNMIGIYKKKPAK